MAADRQHYLNAMGIQRWVPRAVTAVEGASAATPSQENAAGESPPTASPLRSSQTAQPKSVSLTPLDWDDLRERVAGCSFCPELLQRRTQSVFGVGDTQARWMVVGEAPGAEEDRQGEPFVGRAGQLLNRMLQAIGLRRQEVYIANILKCRPPGNRDPRPEEVAHCLPYLQRQMALVQPDVLLVVGRIAAQTLLETSKPIGRLRGAVHHYGPQQVPLVVTYHPAYLLRTPGEKRKAWDDLRLALKASRGGPASNV